MKFIGEMEEGGRPEIIIRSEEIRLYLAVRRLELAGPVIADLARAMGIAPQQAVDILAGRAPLGKSIMKRINKIDPEYELVPLIGVFRKK